MPVSLPLHAGAQPPSVTGTWRGLGEAGDLDLDLKSAAGRAGHRAESVSTLLRHCAVPPVPEESAEAVWQMTLSARIGALLTIWAAGAERDTLDLEPRCPMEACGKGMEVSLPVEALLAMAREAEREPQHRVLLERGPALLRRPCGTDQRAWHGLQHASMAEAAMAVARSLLVEGEANARDRDTLAEALAEFDPLPCFSIETTCPHCASALTLPVDLEAVLLNGLARQQDQLLAEVDHFARRYGWSEREVLAVPAWRRRRYRAMAPDAGVWP